jgi:hypothetical protein
VQDLPAKLCHELHTILVQCSKRLACSTDNRVATTGRQELLLGVRTTRAAGHNSNNGAFLKMLGMLW